MANGNEKPAGSVLNNPKVKVSLKNIERLINKVDKWAIINAIELIFVGIFIALNLVVNSRNKDILEKYVVLENGEITEKISFINQATRSLSITSNDLENIRKRNFYMTFAGGILEYYYKQSIKLSFKKVLEVLMAIDTLVPNYFPNEEFSPEDFYAICAIESNFDHKHIGKKGERGFFQILDWKNALKAIGKPNEDPFDPTVNTEMACYLLKQKYEQYKDKKSVIIAYNGYLKDKNGKVVEKYWRNFKSAEKELIQMKNISKEF